MRTRTSLESNNFENNAWNTFHTETMPTTAKQWKLPEKNQNETKNIPVAQKNMFTPIL